jgi:NTE family protein
MVRILTWLCGAALVGACATPPVPETLAVPASPPPPASVVKSPAPPRVALALGGGAARGFAHIGVIKVLEAQGIKVDLVTGTSAGSLVGALYASGLSGFQLQRLAMDLDEDKFTDWSLPNRGVLRGEALQEFVDRTVRKLPLERLAKPIGVVATDLRNGERVVFRHGDTGMAVRASSAVPGVFKPVGIQGREYVDGGLTSPVPVRAARDMGAEFVIAVDISNLGARKEVTGTLDLLLQTFAIMGRSISDLELADADVVIRPRTLELNTANFEDRHLAILEGEKAASAAMPRLKAKLGAWRRP